MDTDLGRLRQRLRDIEAELEQRLQDQGKQFRYHLDHNRAVFERGVVEQQRKFKTGLLRFLRQTSVVMYLTAPVVYSLIVPLLLLDLFVTVYQWVCFTAWGISRVKRSDYIVLDRHRLAYLNGIEKLNCVYCSYANGLIALVREVAGRTEQYWCPIRHALRISGAHDRYASFIPYGDAEDFRKKLEELRAELRKS